jgi:hypothetical protein
LPSDTAEKDVGVKPLRGRATAAYDVDRCCSFERQARQGTAGGILVAAPQWDADNLFQAQPIFLEIYALNFWGSMLSA